MPKLIKVKACGAWHSFLLSLTVGCGAARSPQGASGAPSSFEASELPRVGHARIEVEVRADGQVVPLRVIEETDPGLGDACMKSVKGQRFEPALNRGGQPITVRAPFACRFEADQP